MSDANHELSGALDADALNLGDGGANRPWRVLHHAVDVINSGSAGAYTLNVAAGIYTLVSNNGDEPGETLSVTQDNVTIIG